MGRPVITDKSVIDRMDTGDLWENYVAATKLWIEFGGEGATLEVRYYRFLMERVAKQSLRIYFERIEEEVW